MSLTMRALNLHALLLLLAVSSQAGAADTGNESLFVRPTADCPSFNGDGTAYACAASNGGVGAWRGFSSTNGSATPSVDTTGVIDGGDTLFVCGNFSAADKDFGTLGQSGTAMFNTSVALAGSVGKRVTVTGDCSGSGGSTRAKIDGGGTAGVDYGFYIKGDYVTVTKIDFTNFWANTNPVVLCGEYIAEPIQCIITDITITNSGFAPCISCQGIAMNSNGGSISKVTISSVGSDGIYIGNGATGNTPTTIDNVSINNVSTLLNNGDGIQQEPGAGPLQITNARITLNKNSVKACIIFGNATSRIVADGVICGGSGAGAGGVVVDGAGPGSYIAHVYAENTSLGNAALYIRAVNAQVTSPIQIFGNTFKGYQYGVLLSGTHSSFPKIYNNTFYGAFAYGVWALSDWNPAAGTIFQNNLVNASGHTIYVDAAVSAVNWTNNYNSYSGSGDYVYRGTTYATFSAYQAGAVKDTNSLGVDPVVSGNMFPQGFRPKSTSPLCNAAFKSPPIPGTYYNGQRFAQSPAIGALACGP